MRSPVQIREAALPGLCECGFLFGEFPEWPNGADCKSVGSAFEGSNPPLPKSEANSLCYKELAHCFISPLSSGETEIMAPYH